MAENTKRHEYRCCHCGGDFVSGWTEEEAAAEVASVFGVQHQETDAEVCDDCYRALVGALSS
jgi:hypothetical protein